LSLSISACTLLAACETPSIDAPLSLYAAAGPGYESDLAYCREQARQVGGRHTGQSAVLGGVGGAIAGGIAAGGDNVPDKALAGAIVGAMAGAAVGDAQVKEAQRRYLVQCMQDKGHPVSG
ncbi:MAG: hypothetical protein AB3N24_18535, partial [Leisingera sp.]